MNICVRCGVGVSADRSGEVQSWSRLSSEPPIHTKQLCATALLSSQSSISIWPRTLLFHPILTAAGHASVMHHDERLSCCYGHTQSNRDADREKMGPLYSRFLALVPLAGLCALQRWAFAGSALCATRHSQILTVCSR